MKQQHRRSTRAANIHPAPLQIAAASNTPATSQSCRPAINAMTPDELRSWIGNTRAALQKKMAREQAYLDRRAERGTHTPTDEAYEMDQVLEADLLHMLDECERHVALMEP
jgi:hypothetical protein